MVVTTYQYPHYLYVLQIDEDATQGPNGSWNVQGPRWELHSACREETNGKGTTINTTNEKTIVFTSLIQLPKGTIRVDEGIEVLVSMEQIDEAQLLDSNFIDSSLISGLIRIKGVCKKYDFGRLHCRLWI